MADSTVDLCLLVTQRDLDRVREYLKAYPDGLHKQRWSGQTPLHRAVASGDFEMCTLLLSHGADPNARTAWGWYSPLHLACKFGQEQIIWLLLEFGAKWSLSDKAKKTPLQWAVRHGKASVSYRVDQQLHARAKALAMEKQQNELQQATQSFSLASIC